MMKKKLYIFCFSFLILLFPQFVNAKVEDYQFLGKSVDDVFSIPSGSSITGNTYIVVTGDSTGKYFVVDLCSTIGINFTSSVPSDFDGSYTSFYDMYDLNSSCSTGSYIGTKIRIFYLITTYADAGGGNLAINNTMKFVNNSTYTGVFKLTSVGLVDTIDLGDLTINNQTTIINGINDINNSISNTEENIKNELNNVKDSINNTITDNFNNCGENVVTLTPRASGKYIDGVNGNFSSNPNFNVSNFYTIVPNSSYTINFNDISGLEWGYFCFYNDNSVVSCKRYNQTDGYASTNFVITSPSNANKITLTYKVNSNANISGNICVNKIDETNEKIDQTNQQLGELNNNLNDSDTTDATNEAGNFFSGFQTDTFGLTSIITAPLNLIGSITSSSCSPLPLQVPFLDNTTLNLPCMSTIYRNYFGSFLSVYQTITFGIVAYWVCVRIFALVKDFKNPDHDEIEVLDL